MVGFTATCRVGIAAAFAACSLAFAQTPAGAPVDDSPRFEIRRFVFDGASLISPEDLRAATAVFTGAGRTFADVQRALETVERAYSEAGYNAVQVALPEQELERGEVRFQIVEAKIGRVLVEGNKFFDEASIRRSVPALVPGRSPNINEISRSLRVANESPAKQATVLLRSGQEEATVDAVVRVVDEKPTKYSLTVDDTGSRQTGRLRVGFGLQNANFFGYDDVLTLQYVTAPYTDFVDKDGEVERFSLLPSRKVTILGAGLRIPLYGRGDSIDLSAGYSNVNSGVVASLFSITGQGVVMGARYTHNLDRLGDYEHRISYALDYRSYDNKGVRLVGDPNNTQLIPDITVHPFSALYSGLWRLRNSETGFSFGFVLNLPGANDGRHANFCASRNNGIGECAEANYEIWKWALNHNHVLPLDWQMRFGMNGQLTSDMLVSGEQFGLGGADSVRGFSEREITNDKGYRGTVEIYTPDFGGRTGVAGARMRALAFVDWGGVRRLEPGPAEPHGQHIWSAGAGIRFSRGTNVALRFDYAIVGGQGGVQSNDDQRFHFSLSFVF